MTAAFDYAAEQGVCTGERPRGTCPHVRSGLSCQASGLGPAVPFRHAPTVVQPPDMASVRSLAGSPWGGARGSARRPSAAMGQESPAPDEVAWATPPSLPASGAGPGAQEPPDRAERQRAAQRRSLWAGGAELLGSLAADPPEVSPTIMPGEPRIAATAVTVHGLMLDRLIRVGDHLPMTALMNRLATPPPTRRLTPRTLWRPAAGRWTAAGSCCWSSAPTAGATP